MGLTRLESDHSVFFGKFSGSPLKGVVVLVYVDNLLITGPNSEVIAIVKDSLQDQFNIKDLGPV